MRNRLLVAWFLVVSCTALNGSEPQSRRPGIGWSTAVWTAQTLLKDSSQVSQDSALPQSLRSQLPAIFRPVRRPLLNSGRSLAKRRSSTFGLKLVVASGDDLLEFLPPIRVEERNEGVFERRELSPSIDDPAVFSDDSVESGLPPLASSPEPLPPSPTPSTSAAVPLDDVFRDEAESRKDKKDKEVEEPTFASERSSFGWLAGNQNHLGMLEYESGPLSRARYDGFAEGQGSHFFLTTPFGARWLNGPNTPDLPPYLFNISISVGTTTQVNDRFAFDASISPGWYSDFSNKGVEAFRLPWQFVTYTKPNEDWQWVLGITDLSRRDIRILPVAGFIYQPKSGDVRLDLVFPKPKIAWRVYETEASWRAVENKESKDGGWTIMKHEGWLYLSGELGGGSWAISRADRSYDVVTYRDYRLFGGFESRRAKGHADRIEIGWIFGRAVEYMSNLGNYNPTDSLMIRYSSDY